MELGFPIAATGFVCLNLAPSLPALADPITVADISGKTFCWSHGDRETYAPGGKYIGKWWGAGTWQVIGEGVVSIKGQAWDISEGIQKLPDGSFDVQAAGGPNWGVHYTGRYCE